MTALAWYLRHWSALPGSTGLAACVLLAGGAVLHWGVTVPGETRLRSERLRHAQLQASRVPQAADAGQGRLAAQLARLPVSGSSTIIAAVAAIQQQAQVHQLAFDSATYQLGTDIGNALERYTVSLPVRGRYPDMRAFIAELRSALPNLALDTISIGRANKEDGRVEAQLQFTVYFRARP